VLFFDEFDILVAANLEVKRSFLNFVRALKQQLQGVAVERRPLLSVVGIGTYEVMKLADADGKASPFNVTEDFKERHFQFDELVAVVRAYAEEHQVELPKLFAEDVFASTHGYAFAVSLSKSHRGHTGTQGSQCSHYGITTRTLCCSTLATMA
jgi:hypothetical protein